MASRASIGGHPIHPMLIPFPIGLLVFSFISDLIYLWRGNPIWKDYIAFYTLLGGIIGAAAAAIPGLIDWATLTDRAAVKVANWHARVNIATLVDLHRQFLSAHQRRRCLVSISADASRDAFTGRRNWFDDRRLVGRSISLQTWRGRRR